MAVLYRHCRQHKCLQLCKPENLKEHENIFLVVHKKRIWGWRDYRGKALALHVVRPGSVLDTTFGPLSIVRSNR